MSLPLLGMILSGGLSRRMSGQDKAFLPLHGKPLIAHVAERLAPQVNRLLINAPDLPQYRQLGLPLVSDSRPGHPGPLAGLEAVMLAHPDTWFLTVAVDLPFLPRDLASQLMDALADAPLIIAASAGQPHPVVGLWSRSLLPSLSRALDRGQRDVQGFHREVAGRILSFPIPEGMPDPFFNINSPHDLTRAETWLEGDWQ